MQPHRHLGWAGGLPWKTSRGRQPAATRSTTQSKHRPIHLKTSTRRAITATLAATLLALTLAACGGEAATDPDPTATQPPTEATRPIEAIRPTDRPIGGAPALPEEVTACLTARGYADAIEAEAAQDAVARDADFQTALEECATEAGVDLPGAPAGGGRPGVDTTALAECLTSEGIETDPDASGGPLAALDRDDPEVAAALDVCGFGGQRQRPAQ